MLKRVRQREIVVCSTDKTGKLTVCSLETYKEMGMKHVEGDKEIDREDVKRVQSQLNQHVSMWLRFSGAGDQWGQEDRFRRTMINHSECVPPLSLLVKDHKTWAKGDLPPTRPVVSGNASMGVHLNNILSEVVEGLADKMEGSTELLSGEDFLSKVDKHNEAVEGDIKEGGVGKEDLILIGTDAVCLFPSLDAEECAKLVAEEYRGSSYDMRITDWREVMRYLKLTLPRSRLLKEGLGRLIPWRKYKYGKEPGLQSATARGKEVKEEEEQFVFPDVEPTKWETNVMISLALEVGIKASFKLHTYTFGGKIYMQLKGGPIGARLTVAVSRVVMELWRRRVRLSLTEAGLKLLIDCGYVDDMRHLLELFQRGWRWDDVEGRFRHCIELEEQDVGKTRKEITCKEILKMMNGIFPFIKFTLEEQEMFADGYLPTLDTRVRLMNNGIIDYRFYEKEMTNTVCLRKKAALGKQLKKSVLIA